MVESFSCPFLVVAPLVVAPAVPLCYPTAEGVGLQLLPFPVVSCDTMASSVGILLARWPVEVALAFVVVHSAPGASALEASSGTLQLVLEGVGLGAALHLQVPMQKAVSRHKTV